MATFANALTNNSSLTKLVLWLYGAAPSQMGWNALAAALCYKSDIASVLESNHMLQEISVGLGIDVPNYVASLLG